MGPDQQPDDPEFDNPYAPPQSTLAPEAFSQPIADMPFTVQDVFYWGLSIFKARMGTCLSIFWGVFGLNAATSLVLNFVQDSIMAAVRDRNAFAVLYILSLFAAFVLQFWLSIGMTLAMIKIARGEPALFEDVFRGGRFLLTAILAWIVHTIIIAAPILIATGIIIGGILLMGDQSGVAAVLLFLVVSGLAGLVFIVLAARVSMYYYIVIDRDAGVLGSLQESWRLTRNQVGTITLVYFVELAVLLAGFLAFCVGLILALPLITILETVIYLALTGNATSGGELPRISGNEET